MELKAQAYDMAVATLPGPDLWRVIQQYRLPNSKCIRRSGNDTQEFFSTLHAHPNGRLSQIFVQLSPARWKYRKLSCIFPPTFHISLFSRFIQIAADVPPKSLLEDVL